MQYFWHPKGSSEFNIFEDIFSGSHAKRRSNVEQNTSFVGGRQQRHSTQRDNVLSTGKYILHRGIMYFLQVNIFYTEG